MSDNMFHFFGGNAKIIANTIPRIGMSGNRESEKGIVDDNFPHWMVMPLFIGEIPISDGWIYIYIYMFDI